MNTKKAVKQLKYLERLAPKELRLAAEWKEKWKILISTILSSQTKDETTIKISKKLYKKYNSPKKLAAANIKDIKKIIRPINFYKTKSKHIKATAKIISDKGIPRSIDELLKLPGVGRKVANVYLAEAYNAPAIGVDTHLSFVAQLLKWSQNKNPHKIEKDLERLFPKKCWNSINYIVVRFGRSYNKKEQVKILNKLMQPKPLKNHID